MNQLGKICQAVALRPLNVVLFGIAHRCHRNPGTGAVRADSPCASREVISGEAAFLNRLLPNQSLRLNLALPLRNIVPPVIPSN